MCTLDSFSSVLACHAIKKSGKRVEESRTKLLLSVLLIFKYLDLLHWRWIDWAIFYVYARYSNSWSFSQFRFFRLFHFRQTPCPFLWIRGNLSFTRRDGTRSRLKFVAVCVARRLITLPAHVSLSGSICPHDIKPFATREFRNWLICLVSFSFFYVTISDNSITPNANNRISLFINHSILSIHHW